MERYLRFVIIGLLFVPRVLSAEARVVKAVRVDEKMSIDGQLKELCWQNTESCSGFIQKYPVEDTVPSESTSVRVMYDNKNLYVGVRAYDSEPDKIVGRLSRRDTWTESDNVVVYIDSYCDKRTCYTFETNPRRVKIDWYVYNDGWSDWSWDAVWDVGTSIDSVGWTAEFSIPFSFSDKTGCYGNFKELIDADRYEFATYQIDMSPDFNQKFLKANAVLRWEYSPGSAVYFVITNALSDFSHPGDFSPIRDLKSTFKASGERIYLIKIDNWVSL